MAAANTFESFVFNEKLRNIDLPDGPETVVSGTGRRWNGLAEAFSDIDNVVVVGYSSQGPAHAQNLRETFAKQGLDIQVKVALRVNSPTRERARADGFTEETDTLVDPEEGLASAGLALMLISDEGMAREGARYLSLLREGAAVGLAHGFYPNYLKATGGDIRSDITVVGVCPKGMGPSVRRLYTQGSGINSSFAVLQAPEGRENHARDLAIGWALGIGSPFTFQTTLEQEARSDIFGERAILLGGVHGIVEAMYERKRNNGSEPDEAYLETVESLVRPISTTISQEGFLGVYNKLDKAGKRTFQKSYDASFPVLHDLMTKIYRDVSSGREIIEVVEDGANNDPMLDVSATRMWREGERVRNENTKELESYVRIDPETAGMYIAGMVAQVDILRANGHYWSETVNESIIEAVDSLNPYMRQKGISHMVDNCSVTARRGDRKWAPVFKARIEQAVLPAIDSEASTKSGHFAKFNSHDVHKALAELSKLRPPIDIAL